MEFVIDGEQLIETKVKFGYGLEWQNTPYAISGGTAVLPLGLVYFNGDNNTIHIKDAQGAVTVIDLFEGFDIADYLGIDQNILTDSEYTAFKKLVAPVPSLATFSSSLASGLTKDTLSGNVTLTFAITNLESVKVGTTTGRIAVSQGTWTGLTFNAKTAITVQVTLSTPLTINSPGSLKFSLYVTDIFDNEIKLGDVNVTYRALAYAGSAATNDVTDFSGLVNLTPYQLTSVSAIGTKEFIHGGANLFDYLFIENSLSQANINIVDFNLQNTPNSFGMFKVDEATLGGKIYSIYVTNNRSFGDTKAVIK
jgi:hypothetical protein